MRYCIVVFAVVSMTGCGGCGAKPYKGIAYGYKIVNETARLTEKFDQGVDKWAKTKDADCTKKHQPKTPEYAKCIDPALKFLRTWHGKVKGKPTGKGVLPAIQSAQRATRLSLDAAFDYIKANEDACKKGSEECKKKSDAWKAALKPGVCALREVVDRAIKLGAYKVTEDSTYKLVMNVAGLWCGK